MARLSDLPDEVILDIFWKVHFMYGLRKQALQAKALRFHYTDDQLRREIELPDLINLRSVNRRFSVLAGTIFVQNVGIFLDTWREGE